MPTCPDALAQLGIWRSGSRAKTVCALAHLQYLWQTQPNKKVVCLTIRDVIRLICV